MNFRSPNSWSSILSIKSAWWDPVVGLISGSPDNKEKEGWVSLTVLIADKDGIFWPLLLSAW